MASIGSISCTFVRGAIPAWKERSEKWQVAGLDGYGVALLGAGDSEFSLQAVFYSNNSGVNLWATSLQALQGSIVTIINDHGDTNIRCFLDKVGTPTKTAAYMPGTGVTLRGEIPIEATIV